MHRPRGCERFQQRSMLEEVVHQHGHQLFGKPPQFLFQRRWHATTRSPIEIPCRDTIAKRVLISADSDRAKNRAKKILRETLNTVTCPRAVSCHVALSFLLIFFGSCLCCDFDASGKYSLSIFFFFFFFEYAKTRNHAICCTFVVIVM